MMPPKLDILRNGTGVLPPPEDRRQRFYLSRNNALLLVKRFPFFFNKITLQYFRMMKKKFLIRQIREISNFAPRNYYRKS